MIRFAQIDAFTSEPFSGNPAAVCVMSEARGDQWMQQVAQEMNLSETAFLVRRSDGAYDLRWFTPSVEVALCGHATLASAHALWEGGHLPGDETARFQTKSGLLTAVKSGDWIELDFPATPAAPADPPAGLIEALGATPRYVGKSRFDYVIELESEAVVTGLQPDFARLRTLPVRGVMVTSRASTPGWDFVTRFFAPGSGIDEDPVTGSAHCCLMPYWSERLRLTELVARQVSPRGGTLRLALHGDRVKLRGQAVTIVTGELRA